MGLFCHVVRKHPPGNVYLPLFGLAWIFSAVVQGAFAAVSSASGSPIGQVVTRGLDVGISLGVPLICSVVALAMCYRVLKCFALFLALTVVVSFSAFVGEQALLHNPLATVYRFPNIGSLSMLAIEKIFLDVLLGILVFPFVWIFVRGVLVSVVCQTGSLCHRCGYERSGLPEEAVCPECGKPPVELHWAWFVSKRVRLCLVLAILILLCIDGIGFAVRWNAIAKPQLMRAPAIPGHPVRVGSMYVEAQGKMLFETTGIVSFHDVPGSPNFRLVLAVPLGKYGNPPAGQLYLAVENEDDSRFVTPTVPFIYCNLDKERLDQLDAYAVAALSSEFGRIANETGARRRLVTPSLFGKAEESISFVDGEAIAVDFNEALSKDKR